MAATHRIMKDSYDVIVIGGGSGGYAAAKSASSEGLDVAIIEGASELGGLCILKGCMPSKTLIESSNRLRAIAEASEFAIDVGEATLKVDELRKRKETLVEGFKHYRKKGLEEGEADLIRGAARFTGEHQIEVDLGDEKKLIEAKVFIIATGSDERIPDIEGLSDTPFWTSDDVVDFPEVPEDLIVLGTGAIGMECAHLFSGFGSKVTILSRSRPLLTDMEPELSEAMEARCRDLGIEIVFEKKIARVSYEEGRFTIHHEDGTRIGGSRLIVAAGRTARIEELNLGALGLEELEIDEHARTKVPHIFAAGDCASPLAVVHLAVQQGEAAGANAAAFISGEELQKTWDKSLMMLGIFTDPELVQIGKVESEQESSVSAIYRYDDQGKGEIVGEKHGLVKLIADKKTGRITGCSGMGPHVIDYSHAVMVAMHQGMTVDEFMTVPFYHPTLGEIWSYVGEELQEKLS